MVTIKPVKPAVQQRNNRWFVILRAMIIVVQALAGLSVSGQDSTRILEEVQIEAYRYNRTLLEVPVSAAILKTSELQRFNNASLLPAVNTIAGVRMEERSPGSYRLSIRGSLVRSPFGVRNVKMYWNGLPFTDGGGNTYLNLLDLSAIGSMEIIKGPGGSLYGAGTGGVVLFKSRRAEQTGLEASTMLGSYGLQRHNIRASLNRASAKGSVAYTRQQSTGYRDHTGMHRDAFNTDWTFALSDHTFLAATVFFTDVFYETPGGLTYQEFLSDPEQARPAAGPNKGAVEQNASVTNKSTFAGINMDHAWNARWSSRFGLFASYADFRNFSIRNLENRFETNVGGRIENQYSFGRDARKNTLTFGGEAQFLASPFLVFENQSGQGGARTFADDLGSLQGLFFVQSEVFLPLDFSITAGVSVNMLRYRFERTFPLADDRSLTFSSEFSPRVALLRRINPQVSAYLSIARGFSPPTLAEVRPSTEVFNNNLEAESGINTEVGVRGNFSALYFDVVVYNFNLANTIVLQRVQDGAEYFVNAGETEQRGVEASFTWSPTQQLKVWSSYSYSHYRFRDYIKDGTDFSGRKLTGVPPVTFSIGADLTMKQKWYVNATAIYTDHIPLNDANSVFAEPYLLLNLKSGWRFGGSKLRGELFAGANNLLNEKHSLGNDLNAFGGRYFNLAPAISIFAGVNLNLSSE